MGNSNTKLSVSPFDQFSRAKRETAKSLIYTPGKASDFYHSCAKGEIDKVRQVLEDENSPSINVLNQLQENGSTPLHAATFYNHIEIVQLLFEHNCSRTSLNRYGNTAYDEAQTDEMKQLFMRTDTAHRFHEINPTDVFALFLPQQDTISENTNQTVNYVHLFRTESEIYEYSLNQQTTVMWFKFYNWFFNSFRRFLQRDDMHIDKFDLVNHPDFNQFLQIALTDPDKYATTIQTINEAKQRNSIEPLITLYTSERAGFYRPFNHLLTQSLTNQNISEHLCDRYVIEFQIRHQELKQRAYIGTVYRGATISIDALNIYRHAMATNPPGIIGLKAFTSTSRDPLIALDFAFRNRLNDNEKHVLFIFEITETSPTIFGIDDISVFGHEQEVLILPGNLFIVKNFIEQTNPSITKIYLSHWKISISFWKKIKQTMQASKKSVL